MEIADLITPALILDKTTLLRNIQMMAEKAQRNQVQLRPHIKTHKCIEIANLQTEYGATGLTISTLGEAAAFINKGFSDITLAYPIIPDKFSALLELAQRAQITVVTDHPAIATRLEARCIAADIELNVLMKIDCGYHRCGVDLKDPKALKLVNQLADASHLTFGGILTHAGHAYNATSQEEIRIIAETEQQVMLQFSKMLNANGFTPETVSIGSTPTAMLAPEFKSGITEIRPGNYVFFDNMQVLLGSCSLTDCALSVLTSIVSVQDSHVVVDAGATALSKDAAATHIDANQGYGIVLIPEDGFEPIVAQITQLSKEHGKIKFPNSNDHSFAPGNHLRIIPNHSCLTANLFDHYYIIDKNRVTTTWPIHRDRLCSPLS
jgi:D-serine deaminase-like pyridoxal phosphate-dependent protein